MTLEQRQQCAHQVESPVGIEPLVADRLRSPGTPGLVLCQPGLLRKTAPAAAEILEQSMHQVERSTLLAGGYASN